ncbi:MAG: phosphate ABC transporter permease PstA [Candidatus Thermoplasmatota archaeon]|nr:phosphate ABC transporter permease PstA [Candidatus Thermoplasmatota archaeon]
MNWSRSKGGPGHDPFQKRFRPGEDLVVWFLLAMASLAIVVSATIIYTLVDGSYDFFTDSRVNIFDFFTGSDWMPNGMDPKFGILPLVQGTILIAGGALLIGGPLGIAAAVYLSEFAHRRVRMVAKPVLEILAGIPSIVYGFFALLVISPFLREYFDADYFNAAAAIIVMAVMVLPIIVSVSDDSMKAVPKHMREASLAMGATKWETATRVVMPAASSGIMASVLLGLARAIGETMVVALAAGSVAKGGWNIFGEHMTMTSYIAQVATGDIPPGVGMQAAFAVGLVLFGMTYIVNSLAARIVLRIKRGKGPSGKGPINKVLREIRPVARVRFIISETWIDLTDRLKRDSKRTSVLGRHIKERVGRAVLSISLIIAVAFLGFLLYTVFVQGYRGLSWEFLTNPLSWKPEKAGIKVVIQGSVYLVLLTMVFTLPVGVGAAIYLNEFARETRFNVFLRRVIQNLAGVPSIVFGLVGLMLFVRTLHFGLSLLSGSLTLSIMVLPVIIVTSEEALRSVPQTFREAARGLGATKWQTVWHHVLPNAVPGILTGSILGLSRAIGETAPILFIASFYSKVAPSSIFDGFVALPINIFYWTKNPSHEFQDLAATTILVLLVILLSMNALAIVIRQRAQSRRQW